MRSCLCDMKAVWSYMCGRKAVWSCLCGKKAVWSTSFSVRTTRICRRRNKTGHNLYIWDQPCLQVLTLVCTSSIYIRQTTFDTAHLALDNLICCLCSRKAVWSCMCDMKTVWSCLCGRKAVWSCLCDMKTVWSCMCDMKTVWNYL